MNPLACPRCHDVGQVQSVQSVCAAQTGRTRSSGVAVGGTIDGPAAMAFTAHGIHASDLALRLALPAAPRRRSPWNCGILLLLAGLAGMGALGLGGDLNHAGLGEPADRVAGPTITVVCLFLVPVVVAAVVLQGRRLHRQYKAYAAVWPTMVAIWRNAMVCVRCHGAFFPPGVSPAGPAGLLIPLDGFQAAVIELGARVAVEAAGRD